MVKIQFCPSAISKIEFETTCNRSILEFEYSYEELKKDSTIRFQKSPNPLSLVFKSMELVSDCIKPGKYYSQAKSLLNSIINVSFNLTLNQNRNENDSIQFEIRPIKPKSITLVTRNQFVIQQVDRYVKLIYYCLRFEIDKLVIIDEVEEIDNSIIKITTDLIKFDDELNKLNYELDIVNQCETKRIVNNLNNNDNSSVCKLQIYWNDKFAHHQQNLIILDEPSNTPIETELISQLEIKSLNLLTVSKFADFF